jgi:hypothetical protein
MAVAKSFSGGVWGGEAAPRFLLLLFAARQRAKEEIARVCDPRAPDVATAMPAYQLLVDHALKMIIIRT